LLTCCTHRSEPDAPLPTDTAGLLRHLEITAPETLALAREWGDIAERIPKTADAIKARQAEEPDHPSVALMMLHYRKLSFMISCLFASLPIQS
jgi:U3 small nucleolar RNA-associated protein 3